MVEKALPQPSSAPMSSSSDNSESCIPEYWIMNWEQFLAGKRFPQMRKLGVYDNESSSDDSSESSSFSSPERSVDFSGFSSKPYGESRKYTENESPLEFNNFRYNATRHISCQTARSVQQQFCDQVRPDSENKISLNHQLTTARRTRGMYRCNLCNRIFSAGYAIIKHIRVHTRETPFECDFCNKRFSQWGNLRLHVQRHLGIKPYRCNRCDKSYIAPSKLEVHMRSHTNERPYPCSLCFAAFKSKDDHQKHMMIHVNHKPFVCWICNDSFAQPSKLKLHLKTKHMLNVDISKEDVSVQGHEYKITMLPNLNF
ncbi:hypothetical protein GJ496_003095 [Pomphorhynchus laevis]|nr:hypothetical protein GJ496_003095 [Pomphorhynchus laevis]